MTSTSQIGQSTITVNLRLNYDSGKALTEISTKVNSVLNQLPAGVQQPVITVKIGQTIDAMYIGFSSDVSAPARSRIISSASCSRICRPCPACRRPN